jgi:hypothetical protein
MTMGAPNWCTNDAHLCWLVGDGAQSWDELLLESVRPEDPGDQSGPLGLRRRQLATAVHQLTGLGTQVVVIRDIVAETQ